MLRAPSVAGCPSSRIARVAATPSGGAAAIGGGLRGRAPSAVRRVEELRGRTRPPSHRFPVFVLATDAASHELLSFIGRSEDFERGYCWIVAAGSGRIDPDGPLLDWLVGECRRRNPAQTSRC